MKITPEFLQYQMQRMMLSESEKKRLEAEIQEADEDKLNLLAALIREHDEEAYAVLNEKAQAKQVIKDRLMEMTPGTEDLELGAEEGQQFLQMMLAIFEDPEKMAKFLIITDDPQLAQLETIFVKALEKSPKYQEAFQIFFREMRLQKATYERNRAADRKEALIESIMQKEQDKAELDEMVAEAERLMAEQSQSSNTSE